ncbi:Pentatricopeptide repeat-containing protein [Actinidia chinensis var. chinensis]|uniref:Pentatricopeptide repeat-containing protein n=1 Tax=Actinidia chinensis var. chinensis TaxID=1590841 RepID=A0A2R6P9Q6_ACTCC|nr:Pentatricopeptide repeat-containing protein [Actinidia chinensis var. chinensis]
MNGTSNVVSKTKNLLTPTAIDQCGSLLHHYATTKSLTSTKKLHARIITSGLLLSSRRSNHLLSLLTTAYAACGHLSRARKLFDELSEPTLLVYNSMIRVCTLNGFSYDALQLFVELLNLGYPKPDKYTYPFVIKACGDLKLLELGVLVHGLTMTSGFGMNTFVGNCLMAMYMNCGEKEVARRVFDTMRERSEVSWNTMISGYCQNGCAEEALRIYNEMVDAGVEPNSATVVSVLPACGHMNDLKCGKQVHELVEKNGLGSNVSVKNALVDMYVKCGCMNEARLVFDKMEKRDVVTWTTMINGYNLNGDGSRALMLCPLMQMEGVRPNSVTVASLLSACADLNSLKQGRCLHGWALRQNLESDVPVETALIDMYAKCNCIRVSFHVFAKTSRKRTVPWNAIIAGSIHNGLAREAIDLFKQMLLEAVAPDDATLNSLLPAYAVLADFQQAMNIHGYLIRSGFSPKLEVATVLIDIYSKCGKIDLAHQIFNGISTKDTDIFCWSTIIAGYGKHGNGEVAVSLFIQMVQSGVEPNEVTFTSVLHACSHSGLVDEGLDLFQFMLQVHKMTPRSDHYTCIVDLLGRAGRLEEAYNLIRTMPFEPNHAVWGALLGACVIHENVDLGELAAKQLFKLEPENTGNYVLMAKIYATAGRWKDAENTRRMIDGIGLRKNPAHSLIEVRNM